MLVSTKHIHSLPSHLNIPPTLQAAAEPALCSPSHTAGAHSPSVSHVVVCASLTLPEHARPPLVPFVTSLMSDLSVRLINSDSTNMNNSFCWISAGQTVSLSCSECHWFEKPHVYWLAELRFGSVWLQSPRLWFPRANTLACFGGILRLS